MPSYRVHATLNLAIGLPLSLGALYYTAVPYTTQEFFSFVGAFLYGTFFLNPDLDLAYKTKLFSLRGFLTLPFRPYSRLFRHRGISHMPVIGTLTRVLWLAALSWLLLGWTVTDWALLWFALGGLALADFFHILLDQLI